MSDAASLKHQAEMCLKHIEIQRKRLLQIAEEVDRLLQPDVLPVGTRVRLKRSFDTPEDAKRWTGWRPYLCFMEPNNKATITKVRVIRTDKNELRIKYDIKFDNQKWTTWDCFNCKCNQCTYEEKCSWGFDQEYIEAIYES